MHSKKGNESVRFCRTSVSACSWRPCRFPNRRPVDAENKVVHGQHPALALRRAATHAPPPAVRPFLCHPSGLHSARVPQRRFRRSSGSQARAGMNEGMKRKCRTDSRGSTEIRRKLTVFRQFHATLLSRTGLADHRARSDVFTISRTRGGVLRRKSLAPCQLPASSPRWGNFTDLMTRCAGRLQRSIPERSRPQFARNRQEIVRCRHPRRRKSRAGTHSGIASGRASGAGSQSRGGIDREAQRP